jgi:DNA-binding response OmpR family regulator
VARILVVEDEPAIAMGLQDNLRIEGHQVEVMAGGVEAEARTRAGDLDLLVLDIILPGRDGLTVCRNLRAAGIRTPILLLTAKGQEADKVAGLDSGADDYVTKPFSQNELLARVRALLRRSSEGADEPSVFESGPLEVDLVRWEVRRRGRQVHLTGTEFRMLRVLIRNRGRMLTVDDILEQVWGRGVFLTERVVYTHINNLRSKIDPAPRTRPLISSVRGVGYRFDG